MASTKLSKAQQAVIDRVLSNPDQEHPCRSVWEILAETPQLAEHSFPVLRNHGAFAGIPDEQIRLVCYVSQPGANGLVMPDCLVGGIARRFTLNAPVEFALRISLAARYAWLDMQCDRNAYPDELFRPLLHAAAAHDFGAIVRIVSWPEEAWQKPNNKDYALILDALIGLIRGDQKRLQQATTLMAKRKPSAYVKAIQQTLIAVAANSPEAFADSLEAMLKAYPRYMYNDDVYRLIDPHAIGLYELVRQHRPDVAKAFDTNHALPWDTGYYEWLQTCQDIAPYYERDRVPEVIRSHVVDLEPLAWGSSFIATVRENQEKAT
jgi:hypothetical protein